LWPNGMSEMMSRTQSVVSTQSEMMIPTSSLLSSEGTADICACCDLPLGKRLMRPKHHCRSCGAYVCNSCSPHRILLDKSSKVRDRVCNGCVEVVAMAPALLASQNAITSCLQEAAGEDVVPAGNLNDALVVCKQAADSLIAQSFVCSGESGDSTSLDGASDDVEQDSSFEIKGCGVVALDVSCFVHKLQGAEKLARWSWADAPGRSFLHFGPSRCSPWMRPHELWIQLMVLQHRLGRNEDVMLRLEIQNAADGEVFESVTQAIAFAETMDRGLVQWVWGDVDLLFARCNRYLWSEKHDGKTAAEEMGSHFGMSDGSRSVRVCTWHTEFKTLNDTIVELGMVGK